MRLISVMLLLLLLGYSDEVDRKNIADILENYDRTYRPGETEGKSTIIKVYFRINSISSISGVTMDYNMDMLLRQSWRDARLAFNGTSHLTLSHYKMNEIWWPDTFFNNAKRAFRHDVTFPNELAHVYGDGLVKTSLRLSVQLSCNMHLQYFPMDTQTCHAILGSFAYPSRDVLYEFERNSTAFAENLLLPEFVIDRDHIKEKRFFLITNTGNFSKLKFSFHLRRDFGYYLIQTYIPSILVVILSWVSFWLDTHATPARISMGLLTVLTMTTQTSAATAKLPRVSYIKAIDIWMSTCLVFVFGALIEFAVVNLLERREEFKEERIRKELQDILSIARNVVLKPENQTTPPVTSPQQTADANVKRERRKAPRMFRMSAHQVDKLSRVLFPCIFGCFNLLYWLHFCCRWFQDGKCT